MAHHGSTPKRILDAPRRSYEVISEQPGLSRPERRGNVAVSFSRRLQAMGLRNTPYVKGQ